jgi:cytochrome c oxidase assembly factor CtaG
MDFHILRGLYLGDTMTIQHFLLVGWDPEPSVIAGCVLLLGGYALAGGFRHPGKAAWFVLSVLTLLVALISPLDTLADHYLFSAHMAQHMVLYEAVPVFLLLGLPVAMVRRLLAWQPAAAAERFLRRPRIAWFIGIVTLWVWHLPWLFALALRNDPLHILQHLCFLVAGTIFWWPILSPLDESRPNTFVSIAYLFLGCLGTSLLGLLITFHSPGLYPAYIAPTDPYGILPALRSDGLSVANDQHLGGMLMWAPCCLIYVTAVMATLAHWYSQENAQPVQVADLAAPLAKEPTPH